MTTRTATALPYQTIAADRIGGTSRLYRDFLTAPGTVQPFFGPAFDDEPATRALVKQLASRPYARTALHTALSELAAELEAPAAALESLGRFLQDGTLVVFAGQQAGLFTGPLYTVYKALTVERWARELSLRLDLPVVPCFWLSSDDHDFAEVEWVGLPRGGELERFRYRPDPEPSGDPVGRIRIDAGIVEVIRQVASALPASEFADGVFEKVRAAYRPGSRYVAALGRLWYKLFPQSRLVFVSPCQPAFARAAAPLLRRALAEDEHLYGLYRDVTDRLVRLGYHAQVHKTADQTFLFYQQFKRHSIHRRGAAFEWEGSEPVAAEALLDQISAHPEYFSPNVLLRPVVQNGLFPTLGVVVGPSEAAYYAQIGPLHDHFGVPRPLVMPRTSVTLLEAAVAKRVERHKLDLWALRSDCDGEVARALRASFPQDLHQSFEQAMQQVESAFERVRPEVASFDSTLEAPVRSASHRARREMEQIAQRAYAAHKRREEETESQIRRAALQLFPAGGLQERSFNIVYYWARYGPDFLHNLYQFLPAGQRGHLLWQL